MGNNIRKILRERLNEVSSGLIAEYEILPYKLYERDPERLSANFKASGLDYSVSLWHDDRKHAFGEYELAFSVAGQEHEAERQGKDIKHFNNVMYTVAEIAEKLIKKHQIKTIKIDGARDEYDNESFMNFDTLRGKLYFRFLKNRYPNDAIDAFGRHIKIDMTKVFPNEISNEKTIIDEIIDLLVEISDDNQNIDDIKRGLSGSEDMFSISTDFIENSELGRIYVEIDANTNNNEYSLSWDIYNEGDEGSEYFDSLDKLKKFIKHKFNVQ
jgi:hypothetical protein